MSQIKFDFKHSMILICIAKGINSPPKIKRALQYKFKDDWELKNRLFALKKKEFIDSTIRRIENKNTATYCLKPELMFHIYKQYLIQFKDADLIKFEKEYLKDLDYSPHIHELLFQSFTLFLKSRPLKQYEFDTLLLDYITNMGYNSDLIFSKFVNISDKPQDAKQNMKNKFGQALIKYMSNDSGYSIIFITSCWLFFLKKVVKH